MCAKKENLKSCCRMILQKPGLKVKLSILKVANYPVGSLERASCDVHAEISEDFLKCKTSVDTLKTLPGLRHVVF